MRGKEKRPPPPQKKSPAEFAVVSPSILPNFFLAPLCFSPSKRTLRAEETLKAHIRLRAGITGVLVPRLKACRVADSGGSVAKYHALPCMLEAVDSETSAPLFSVNSTQTITGLGRGNH